MMESSINTASDIIKQCCEPPKTDEFPASTDPKAGAVRKALLALSELSGQGVERAKTAKLGALLRAAEGRCNKFWILVSFLGEVSLICFFRMMFIVQELGIHQMCIPIQVFSVNLGNVMT